MSIITRKIELYIPDGELKVQHWSMLRQLSYDTYKAANMVINHQFAGEALVQRITSINAKRSAEHEALQQELTLLTEQLSSITEQRQATALRKQQEKLRKKSQDVEKTIRKEAQEEAQKFYEGSRQNSTYQVLSVEFPQMSSYIRGALNNLIVQSYSNDLKDVFRGERSLRTYKRGMPIPFMASALRIRRDETGEFLFHWVDGITFKPRFGYDKSGNRIIVERVMSGEYSMGDSSIQVKEVKGKQTKIFLLLCVHLPDEKHELNPNLVVGVDLGIAVPAYAALSEGQARMGIGSKDDFLRVRLQMQKRQRLLQKSLKISNGGHGRGKKLKALNALEQKERNFARTYNHNLSHHIIKFALDHLAGTIHLELLEGFSEEDRSNTILRNWSYFELQTMIEQKAKRVGIAVRYIDPYHTSQTCSTCGHYEAGQRTAQEKFVCRNAECRKFDEIVNADYNAAINIARSTRFVESKEDCEIYKRKTAEQSARAVSRPNGEGDSATH